MAGAQTVYAATYSGRVFAASTTTGQELRRRTVLDGASAGRREFVWVWAAGLEPEQPDERRAQQGLADAVTALVHGEHEVRRANLAAGVLFGGGALDADALEALRGIVPETEVTSVLLDSDEAVIDLLVASGVASSKGDARRTLGQGGIRLNGERVDDGAAPVPLVDDRYVLVQKGKKQRHLVIVTA